MVIFKSNVDGKLLNGFYVHFTSEILYSSSFHVDRELKFKIIFSDVPNYILRLT